MVFENNFVFPFPRTMYDPTLKVRVSIQDIREAGPDQLQIGIYYDPEIQADHLTVPVSEETKAFWRSRPQDAHKADDDSIRWPFMSGNDVKIYDYPCHWERDGEVIRLKINENVETLPQVCRNIKELNIPVISENLLSFLIYVYKNFIKLSGLEEEYYSKDICPNSKHAEFCLNADAFLNAFGLSPADYAEVEPGWYCLASKELAR